MRLGRDGIAGLIGLAVSLLLLPLGARPAEAADRARRPRLLSRHRAGRSWRDQRGAACCRTSSRSASAARLAATEMPAQPKRAYGLVAAAFAIVAAYIALLPLHRLSHRHGAVRCRLPAGARAAAHAAASGRCWLAIAVGTSARDLPGVRAPICLVLLPRGALDGLVSHARAARQRHRHGPALEVPAAAVLRHARRRGRRCPAGRHHHDDDHRAAALHLRAGAAGGAGGDDRRLRRRLGRRSHHRLPDRHSRHAVGDRHHLRRLSHGAQGPARARGVARRVGVVLRRAGGRRCS